MRVSGAKLKKLAARFFHNLPRVFGAMSVVFTVLYFFKVFQNDLESTGIRGLAIYVAVAAVIAFFISSIEVFRYTHIRVAQFAKLLPYMPLYVADVLGYFEQEGIKVKFSDSHGAKEAWHRVFSQECHVGVTDPIVHLDEHAGQGVIIASLVAKPVVWGVTRDQTFSIAELDRSEANIYVWDRHTTTNKIVRYFIKSRFPKKEPAILERLHEVAPGSEYAFIDNDKTGIVFLNEPNASRAELSGAREVFSAAQLFNSFFFTGLFVRRDFLKNNREELVRFISAVERAMQFIQDNKGATIDIAIQEFHSIDCKVVMRAMTRLYLDDIFPKHTVVDQEGWSNALRVRFGADESKYSFSDHVDVTVSQDARKRLEKRNSVIKRLSNAWKRRSGNQTGVSA